ncbi:MAG: WD40 repeat domain-containing protein [Acidimicrobiia bacterium]
MSHRGRSLALLVSIAAFLVPFGPASPGVRAATPSGGYWMVATDGGIFSFGDAAFYGSTGAVRLNQPIVGMASTPSGAGYWMVASDGGIFSFGDAAFFGSTGSVRLNQPIVGMAATPSGRGYWLVASDGGIFSFGDARFFGSTGSVRLNRPIVGMTATPSGAGYWMVASDGGIFSFGDARFFGSTGAVRLARPIVGMASTPSGAGYWMVAADGGVFTFGDAGFFGAGPDRAPRPGAPRAVVGLVPSPTGKGYWQAAASGELLAFGDAADLGGTGGLNRPVVGLAAPRRGTGPSGGGTAPGGGGSVITPLSVGPERFSTSANSTWGTSPGEPDKAGRVLAMVEHGGVVYLGGEFTGFVPPAGSPVTPRSYLAAIDAGTGKLRSWNPAPDGSVRALAVSADGRRLYVGGDFNTIGGAAARNLAAVDTSTGALDTSFSPPLLNSGVRAIALAGNRLYAGGNFTNAKIPPGQPGAGDHSRPQVASFDAGSGALVRDWAPPPNTGGRYLGHEGTPTEDGNDGLVHDIAVSADGATVHVAGDFLHFAGRAGILSLDAAAGRPTAWQAVSDRPVFSLAVSPADGRTVYAATGGKGGRLWRFEPGGQTTPVWEVKTDGDNVDVVATGSMVYLIGHYDNIVPRGSSCYQACPDGTGRRHLSAVVAATGKLDAWNPEANTPQGPYVAAVGARHLYVGGDFTKVNLKAQPGFAQFNAR